MLSYLIKLGLTIITLRLRNYIQLGPGHMMRLSGVLTGLMTPPEMKIIEQMLPFGMVRISSVMKN